MHKCQQTFSQMESGEPDIQSEDLNGTEVNITVRIHRDCCDCGTETKEYTFELTGDYATELEEHTQTHVDKGEAEPEYELCDVSAEMTEDVKRTDRHGKAIRNPRYMKTLYGASVKFVIRCQACAGSADGDAEADVVNGTLNDKVKASGMEELE